MIIKKPCGGSVPGRINSTWKGLDTKTSTTYLKNSKEGREAADVQRERIAEGDELRAGRGQTIHSAVRNWDSVLALMQTRWTVLSWA